MEKASKKASELETGGQQAEDRWIQTVWSKVTIRGLKVPLVSGWKRLSVERVRAIVRLELQHAPDDFQVIEWKSSKQVIE
eukprot:1195260-Rhodomonas_salina.1